MLLHTILDERLVISEIKAMKLLISTLFTLLLIGFAGGSYGQDIRTITYSDGDVYVGEHKDDKANGQGTYTYASGDVYVGEWKDDQRNGQGTYTYASGKVENGIWLENAFIVVNDIAPVTEAPPVDRRKSLDDFFLE